MTLKLMMLQTTVRTKNTSLKGVNTESQGRELLRFRCHLYGRLSGLPGPLLIIRLVVRLMEPRLPLSMQYKR